MSDEELDEAYNRGRRHAWSHLLGECIAELGYAERTRDQLAKEREDAIAQLRQVCERFGDNDWPDDLHLGDVIEKHLWRHLENNEV